MMCTQRVKAAGEVKSDGYMKGIRFDGRMTFEGAKFGAVQRAKAAYCDEVKLGGYEGISL